MRKCFKIVSMFLSLMMLLSVTVFAAEGPSVTPAEGNVTAKFDDAFAKIEKLTYNSGKIVKGGQYMIFVVTADEDGDYIPTESSILYIDQVKASEDGVVSFVNIYPKTITNSAIMISGTGIGDPTVIATIEVPYIKGDVSGEGAIDTYDATMVLRHDAGIEPIEASQLPAADVSGEGVVDTYDATMILKLDAGLIKEF